MIRLAVSDAKPDGAGPGEWIDIAGHVGRLMSMLMADGRPLDVTVTPDGVTTVTALTAQPAGPQDARTVVGHDAEGERSKATDAVGRVTSRTELLERFKSRLAENLHGGKQ